MKRNKEMVPEFDEIIFGNRNQSYGAFVLRKRYKSVLSLSVLYGIAFFSVLALVAFAFRPEETIATPGPQTIVIAMEDPLIKQIEKPAELKIPDERSLPKNIVPVVIESDTTLSDYLPTADEISIHTQDGNVNDTMDYSVITPDPIIDSDETEIPVFVQEMPQFPGGTQALMKFISENLNYPQDALENNIQGRVTLKFVVNSDGSVNRIELLRGVDPLLDNEAIRIISQLPRFKPGRQNGIPVPVWFTIPVVFQIKQN